MPAKGEKSSSRCGIVYGDGFRAFAILLVVADCDRSSSRGKITVLLMRTPIAFLRRHFRFGRGALAQSFVARRGSDEPVSSAGFAAQQRALAGRLTDPIIFVCFFISGFCSLLYEVLWTRLAFAHFGIITPVLSLVVSVFMLGLGIGTVFGGRLAAFATRRFRISPIYLYAAAEGLVAIGAFVVPSLFNWSAMLLVQAGAASSVTFLILSAACIVVALLPWCVAMGATIPLMMAFVRGVNPDTRESFSFLYSANVFGAATGAILTAMVLIEAFRSARHVYVSRSR